MPCMSKLRRGRFNGSGERKEAVGQVGHVPHGEAIGAASRVPRRR